MPSWPTTTCKALVVWVDIGINELFLIALAALPFNLLTSDQEAWCYGKPCLLRLEPFWVQALVCFDS